MVNHYLCQGREIVQGETPAYRGLLKKKAQAPMKKEVPSWAA